MEILTGIHLRQKKEEGALTFGMALLSRGLLLKATAHLTCFGRRKTEEERRL